MTYQSSIHLDCGIILSILINLELSLIDYEFHSQTLIVNLDPGLVVHVLNSSWRIENYISWYESQVGGINVTSLLFCLVLGFRLFILLSEFVQSNSLLICVVPSFILSCIGQKKKITVRTSCDRNAMVSWVFHSCSRVSIAVHFLLQCLGRVCLVFVSCCRVSWSLSSLSVKKTPKKKDFGSLSY